MAQSLCYSGKNSILVINGRVMRGFNDAEDSISIEYAEDSASIVEGLNGAAQVNLSTSNLVNIGIKILVTHPDHAWLRKIDANMRQGVCIPLDISFTEVATGEGGTSDSAALTGSATINSGKSANGERTWSFQAANWVSNDITFI